MQPKMAEQLNIWDRIKRELALQVAYLPLQPVVNYLLAAAVATMIWLFTTYQDWWWPWAALISVAVFVLVTFARGYHKHGASGRGRAIVGIGLLIIAGLFLVGSLATGFTAYTLLWGTKTASTEELPSASENKPTPEQLPPQGATPEPSDKNLVGTARLIYDTKDQSLSVIKTEGLQSTVITQNDPGNYLTIFKSYTVTFLFPAEGGPFFV